jgi:hypothetical protein
MIERNGMILRLAVLAQDRVYKWSEAPKGQAK